MSEIEESAILVGRVMVGINDCSSVMLKKDLTWSFEFTLSPSIFMSPVMMHFLFSLFTLVIIESNCCVKTLDYSRMFNHAFTTKFNLHFS